MEKIKFSIIIPVFNAEKYIEKCIKSILCQSYNNIEIIAVNDGSSDSSLLLLQEMSIHDNRLIVLTQQNAGPSSARNLGIKNSSGDYLSFVDADDWIEKFAFEHLYLQIINSNSPDIIMFNAFKNDSFKNKPFLKTGLYDLNGIKNNIYPRLIESIDSKNGTAIRASVCLRIFKKELILNKIWFNSALVNNEDLVFCFEATINAQNFLYLAESYLYHNCMTTGSLSRGYTKDAFVKMEPLFEALSKISNGYEEYDFKDQIKARVFRTLVFCIENEFNKENTKYFFKKYQYIKMLMKEKEFAKYLSDFKPAKEKSKVAYFYFYKYRMIVCAMILSYYRVQKQNKQSYYV